MKRITCKSGLTGWRGRLHKVYGSYLSWENSALMYGLHTRLGYKTPKTAWLRNPEVEGSVNPSDYRKVR